MTSRSSRFIPSQTGKQDLRKTTPTHQLGSSNGTISPPKSLISSRLHKTNISRNVNETHQSDFGSEKRVPLETSADQQVKKGKSKTSWFSFMKSSSKEAPKDHASSAKPIKTSETSKVPTGMRYELIQAKEKINNSLRIGSAKQSLRTSLSTEKHLTRIQSSVRLKSPSAEKTIPPPPAVPAPPPKALLSNFKTSIKSKVGTNGSNVKPATAPSFLNKTSKSSRNTKTTSAAPKPTATTKPSTVPHSKAGPLTSSPRESFAVEPTSPCQTPRPAKSPNQASRLPVPVRNPKIQLYTALAYSKIPFKNLFGSSSSESDKSIESDSISELGHIENKNDSIAEQGTSSVDAKIEDISLKNEENENSTTIIESHTQSTVHSDSSFSEEDDEKTEKIEKEEKPECSATNSVEINENKSDSTKVNVEDDTREVAEVVEDKLKVTDKEDEPREAIKEEEQIQNSPLIPFIPHGLFGTSNAKKTLQPVFHPPPPIFTDPNEPIHPKYGLPMSKLKNFLPALLKKEQEEQEEREEEEKARLEALRNPKPNKEELEAKCRKREMNAIFTGKARLNPKFTQRYKLHELLGEGAFGFVFAATRLEDKKLVAIKFMIRDKVPRHVWVEDPVLGLVPSEITILRDLNHPNVIKYVEHVMPSKENGRYIILITELHGTEWDVSSNPALSPQKHLGLRTSNRSKHEQPKEGVKRRAPCDLFECIDAHERIPESTAKHIFAQIALAVHYLNKKGYVHRDLKDENIVVDENYHVKLIDFGSAAVIPKLKHKFFNYFNGTMHYASPEICSGETYQGPEAEVWTLGILLYTIMFAENPFQDRNEILNGDYKFPKAISSDCGNLIDQLLEWDPDDRITIDEVIKHPWIADEIKKLQSTMPSGAQ
ncbi:hypothetical protein HK098_001212 [Nowakowskiella sp. JEL0407]|nr:hypothetical protein HK098_001212 [Nowakowskiella sp. JEL0407]